MNEPTAVCLKAAYRLLKALNNSPEPPSIDTLALIIDETLRYSDAIGFIDEAAIHFSNDGQMTETARAFEEFVQWARS
jgi:hypothetical protein